MKYYYIRKISNYSTLFGTSGPSIVRKTLDIELNDGYLIEPVKVSIGGRPDELNLRFFPVVSGIST